MTTRRHDPPATADRLQRFRRRPGHRLPARAVPDHRPAAGRPRRDGRAAPRAADRSPDWPTWTCFAPSPGSSWSGTCWKPPPGCWPASTWEPPSTATSTRPPTSGSPYFTLRGPTPRRWRSTPSAWPSALGNGIVRSDRRMRSGEFKLAHVRTWGMEFQWAHHRPGRVRPRGPPGGPHRAGRARDEGAGVVPAARGGRGGRIRGRPAARAHGDGRHRLGASRAQPGQPGPAQRGACCAS